MNRSGCPPRLANYEVHVVTSCIKKFLRSLKEPIIPLSLWQVFVDAASNPDTTDIEAAMYQVKLWVDKSRRWRVHPPPPPHNIITSYGMNINIHGTHIYIYLSYPGGQ